MFEKTNRLTVSVPLKEKLKHCLDNQTMIFANQTFHRYMEQYSPKITGNMIETVDIQPDGIHFGEEYANRNYYGDDFNFSKEKNPLAQAHWGEVAGALHGSQIAKAVEDYIKAKKL